MATSGFRRNEDAKLTATTKAALDRRKHVVLIGAGHAHVEVLRRFRLRPDPLVRLTLVTTGPDTSYSGMVPGYVAGHYSRAAIHIRVDRLANFEACTAVFQRAIELEAESCRVSLADGSSIRGDVVSIDVGARANQATLAGHHVMIVPTKPMDDFERGWAQAEPLLQAEENISFAILGGGGAGVEVALAIRHRLNHLPRQRASRRSRRAYRTWPGDPSWIFGQRSESSDPNTVGPRRRGQNQCRWQRRRCPRSGSFSAD